VRPQLEIRKIVAIVHYRFTHGHSATHMADHFNVSALTTQEYVDIVCDVFIDRNNFLSKYIKILAWNQLRLMIHEFQEMISLLNICRSIDGTHIPLVGLPSKKVTFAQNDFFNRKNSYEYRFARCVGCK
jgi:hypothetical protein